MTSPRHPKRVVLPMLGLGLQVDGLVLPAAGGDRCVLDKDGSCRHVLEGLYQGGKTREGEQQCGRVCPGEVAGKWLVL